MTRLNGIALLVLAGIVVLIGGGGLITGIAKVRTSQARLYCANNLRQLGTFAATPQIVPGEAKPGPVRSAVPPGTVFNPDLLPDRRLSWVADALPIFNQKQQDVTTLMREIDRTAAWDDGPNAAAARTPLGVLTDYGNPASVPPDTPAVTQYVGMAGCFRYDGPTPYDDIADGLSNTILFAETNRDLGPWLRGGPSTVRGLSVGADAPTPVAVGGQFGGNHPGGGNFGFVDASVRFLSDRISAEVFRGLVTIAGGESDGIPGE